MSIVLPARDSCIKFVFVGDTHLGNVNTDEGLVGEVAKRLQEPNTYWVDLGDCCDFINVGDWRFDPTQLPEWIGIADLADLPAAQIRRYTEFFKPVTKRCLARLCGNHEDSIRRKFERHIYAELGHSVGIHLEPEGFAIEGPRMLGFSGFLRVKFYVSDGGAHRSKYGKCVWSLDFFLHHGAGGGRLAGAKALKLERLPIGFDADVYAIGHTHAKLALNKRQTRMGRHRKIVSRPQVMINTGAYMRGEEGGYSERALFYPQGLGPVELWVWAMDRKVKVIQ